MPVYHFTYHAHGSWLPDHHRGYTRRGARILPTDSKMAGRYRGHMKQPPVSFIDPMQELLIDELKRACHAQGYTLHSVATDATHVHVVVAWTTDRPWVRVRAGLQSSMTRRLNRKLGKHKWFVSNPSRKRVKDEAHLGYLIDTYHPSHRGWKWNRQRGAYR